MRWGKLAIINLYKCNEGIKKKSKIQEFIQILCEVINIKRVGPTRIKRFGKDKLKGYSAFQFIETSSIICHFDETQNRAFIDIFSCKNFDEKKAKDFAEKFFGAKKCKIRIIERE